MAGRTHGVVAEPTSFGHKVALWAFELDRDRDRLRRAREAVSVGAISGAVGTYAQVDPRIEEEVCAKLGLRAAEASSQIVARDRHAELMGALAITASTLDAIATEIRHLARTEVREVQEPFTTGQKGSSAMPHKRNPVRCERVTGLARVIRGEPAGGAREHRAVARARHLALVGRARDPARLDDRARLHARGDDRGARGARGVPRADAGEPARSAAGWPSRRTCCSRWWTRGCRATRRTRSCRTAAAAAWDEGASFRDVLAADARVRGRIGDRLDELFDPAAALRNLDVVFDRLEKVEVRQG